MPGTFDRITLTMLMILLLSPFCIALLRIANSAAGEKQANSRSSGNYAEPKQKISEVEAVDQPGMTERRETVYAWTTVWHGIGRFGHFGPHRGVAVVGLFALGVMSISTAICIWFPRIIR
jgi:hypothetical protein